MTGVVFEIVPRGAYDRLRRALQGAQLPTDDLMAAERFFFELSDDTGFIGYVGLEGTGTDLLLRSLVVDVNRRRQGLADLLVAHVERVAHKSGAERLHLLTTKATSFFRKNGYAAANRATAPASIAGTAQFSSLCPASATYLVKDIA